MKPKVFISSTYYDLIPFREKLWEILSDLNIKILGMEKFGARKSAPLETCLEEVTKCNIYIGIIAYRYGSIEKTTNKSFTQIEYEKALQLSKEILIYIFDENGFLKPKYIDYGEKRKHLEEFKTILKDNHTPDYFAEPHELGQKIYERLKELIPKLPSKFIRPKILSSKVFRFQFDNQEWIAFIGYLYEKPIEIFTVPGKDDFFPIPKSIKTGKIFKIKNEDGHYRYDFQYKDKFGYFNTMGGISHNFHAQIHSYTKIITALLQEQVQFEVIQSTIDEMDVSDNKNQKQWKAAIKKILQKK